MHVRRVIRRRAALVAVWAACSTGVAGDDAGLIRNFVGCPVARDTASVPCWLAEYDGELYFLTLQSDVSAPVTPPWLGHRVLVEGTVSNEPRICGGKVLKPVHLSVLERDASCNTLLPAEDRYNLTFEPPRPPGPSKGRLAFDAAPPPQPAAASPAAVKTFVIPYDFNGLVGFSHPRLLSEVLDFAQAATATQVDIVGYRGAVRLSNGQVLVEEPAIGQRRAEQIAMLLRGADLTSPSYHVTWKDEPAKVTGRDDYLTRRVVVTVRTRQR